MNVIYRQGGKEDSYRIAQLDSLASAGMTEFLFHDLVANTTAVEIVCAQLQQDVYPYSYRSAIVAEVDQQVVGMALSFPSSYHRIDAEMQQFFPADRLAHLQAFFSTRVDGSYYLDAIGIDEDFTSQGIGYELLQRTAMKALNEGYEVLSLIVYADNTRAIQFYQRHGFQFVRKIPLKPHKLIPHHGGCLLLKSHLH